jgi:hypothetical protein
VSGSEGRFPKSLLEFQRRFATESAGAGDLFERRSPEGFCLPGLRRGARLAAENQSLHLRVRRLRAEDLGDRGHDHARPQAAADDVVLGGVFDGDALQWHLGAAAAEPAEPGYGPTHNAYPRRIGDGWAASGRRTNGPTGPGEPGIEIAALMRCTTSKVAPEGAELSCTADRVLFARPRRGIAELRAIGACRRRVYRRFRLPHRRSQTRKTPIILRCRCGLRHLPALRSVASLIKPLIPDEKPCLHPHRTSRDFSAPANGSNASCNEYICRQQDRSCAAHMLQAQPFACGADQAYGRGLTEETRKKFFSTACV